MKIDELDVNQAIGKVGEILTDTQRKRGLLIYAFQQIQKEHNYLPEEELKALSRKLSIPLAIVYSTASFYKHFYFKPRGKNVMCVCMGTACHVRGASAILEVVKDHFKIDEGETTADMSLTLETVGCVGCCGLAPVVTINEEIVGEVGPKKVKELFAHIGEGNGKNK